MHPDAGTPQQSALPPELEEFLAKAGEVTDKPSFAALLEAFTELAGQSAEVVARRINDRDPRRKGFSERAVKDWWAAKTLPQTDKSIVTLMGYLAKVVAEISKVDVELVKGPLVKAGLRALGSGIAAKRPVDAAIPMDRQDKPPGQRTPAPVVDFDLLGFDGGAGRGGRIDFGVLPEPEFGFVGRLSELKHLDTLRGGASVAVVYSVGGFGGVGKTALASHYARTVAGKYPDGLIFIDFKSYSDHTTVSVEQALRLLLIGALGIDRLEVVAMAEQELCDAWHRKVDGRAMVFMWDNISEPNQIEPLLVRNNASLTLVTTRDRIHVPGSKLIDLDVMNPDDAIELFIRVAGADNCPDLEVVRSVAEQCGFVPVLLEIKARDVACLVATPERIVQDMAELPRADTKEGLYSRLDMSYRTLTADQQEVYRIMGLHPARYLTVATCAAVLAARRGTEPDIFAAVKILTGLTRRGMARPMTTDAEATSVAQRAFTAHDVLLDHADHLATVHNHDSDGDEQ